MVEKLVNSNKYWEYSLSNDPIHTWDALIKRSYVIAFVQQNESITNDTVLVHVDDPLEQIILKEVSRFKAKMKKQDVHLADIIGIYLMQNIICQSSFDDSNLYYKDCTSERVRFVLKQYYQ